MVQTKFVNLPVVGRVQHGEQVINNGVKKVKELGHFIMKIEDEHMNPYLQKFDQKYKGKKSIDIVIFNEEPLKMKYVRFNQGGQACSCNVESNIASCKTKDSWQKIECNENCKYRQKDDKGKSLCNRIGWLKFIMPDICKDRIFLMKITGQTSLNRLDDYFRLQKALGNSLKGQYTLFLKQEEQSNIFARSFTHYILDIFNKEDFNSTKQIPQKTEEPKVQNIVKDTNVDNSIKNQNNIIDMPKSNATNNTTTVNKSSNKTTVVKNGSV